MSIYDPKTFRKCKDPRLVALAEKNGEMPLVIEARKPDKESFVRARVGEEFQAVVPLLCFREANRDVHYFLHRDLEIPASLQPHVHDCQAIAAITLEKVPFLWIMRVSDTEWYTSAVDAMRSATEKWIKVIPNEAHTGYEAIEAVDDWGEPTWPEVSLETYFERAFEKRTIDSASHKIVKKLLGVR